MFYTIYFFLQSIEQEVSNIAPDAATLISKGDSLILASHTEDPSRANTLCTLIQDRLRVMWTHIMSEIEVKFDISNIFFI